MVVSRWSMSVHSRNAELTGNVPFATHLFMNPNLSNPIPASLPGHGHKWYRLQIFISVSGKSDKFWLVEVDFLYIVELKVTAVSHGWRSWVVNSEGSVVCSRGSWVRESGYLDFPPYVCLFWAN